MLRVTYFVPIYGFSWASPSLSSLLFYSSCGLLFRIMNDRTTKNFLKYEKAVILSNFSPIFFEPQVSYFNSKNSKTLQVYHSMIQISNSNGENELFFACF